MDLNTLWFALVAILFTGFFFLEGFDFGVGILLPFLGKDDTERRQIINSIGPVWDANEVWLLTAGGAMFAAFPRWYATMFSGFYLALVLLLFALILRGVAFEFRSKDKNTTWRNMWDWAIFGGSLLPALLIGVAFGNIVHGTPIDAKMNFTGNSLTLLNPYALLVGLTSLIGFVLHGALYLMLKTTGALADRARAVANRFWIPSLTLVVMLALFSLAATDIFRNGLPWVTAIGAVAALAGCGWFIRRGRYGWAFILNGVTIALVTLTAFGGLYPRVMVSNLDPNWSLTIYNAASGPYTLQVMTIVALIFVPIVVAYQGWTYWVFRERVGKKLEY
jgi:cytochrome d ubiquinol oxidase subunit II